jgi:hypothetical protein
MRYKLEGSFFNKKIVFKKNNIFFFNALSFLFFSKAKAKFVKKKKKALQLHGRWRPCSQRLKFCFRRWRAF